MEEKCFGGKLCGSFLGTRIFIVTIFGLHLENF